MRKSFLLLATFIGILNSAQNTYIDVTTTIALNTFANSIENEQNKTIEQQTKLQQAQSWVGAQMAVANDIQNKVLKGLREVSGTLSNGIQFKQIANSLEHCYQYTNQILVIVADHPQYSVFGIKSSEKVYTSALDIFTECSDVLEPGELNLATAGDRSRILTNILQKVMILEMWVLDVKLRLERAIRIGFWKSANPFQGYVDTDKSIVDNIMNQYKWNF